MSDRLMQSLGRIAREQAGDAAGDDRWAALCAGELSAAEEEALRAKARTSESSRRAVEAFEPLGPEFRQRVVHRLRRQIETETTIAKRSGEVESGEAESGEAGAGETEPAGRPSTARGRKSRVLPRADPAVWWRWPPVAMVAAAAAVAIVMVWPRAEPPPLPVYHPALAGGAASSRTPEAPSQPRFVAGSPFRLVLRPETEVEDSMEVRAFLGHGQALEPWDVSAEISEKGSVLIEGTLGDDVRLAAGQHVLSILIGRRGELDEAELPRDFLPDDLAPRRSRDWVLVRLAVTVEEGP